MSVGVNSTLVVKPEHDLLMRSIKIVDIAFISTLYFLVAYYLAKSLDIFFTKYIGKLEEGKKYTQFQLMTEIIIQMSITGILSYVGRNLIQMIPFPLDKYQGFDHMKVKEVSSGALLTALLVFFQTNLMSKINYLKTL
jgi:hypothetical protein